MGKLVRNCLFFVFGGIFVRFYRLLAILNVLQTHPSQRQDPITQKLDSVSKYLEIYLPKYVTGV